MKKRKLTISNMSEIQKQKTVLAVFEAIDISNQRSREMKETITIHERKNYRLQRKLTTYLNTTKVFIALIVGHSQQRLIKHRIRQNDVWRESVKIARETGADAVEIETVFLRIMDKYIKPKQ